MGQAYMWAVACSPAKDSSLVSAELGLPALHSPLFGILLVSACRMGTSGMKITNVFNANCLSQSLQGPKKP